MTISSSIVMLLHVMIMGCDKVAILACFGGAEQSQ